MINLVILISLIVLFVSLLPQVRNGQRVFSPFPGAILIRLKTKFSENEKVSNTKVLDLFIVGLIASLALGYYILVKSLLPKSPSAIKPLIPGVTISLDLLISILWVIGISVLIHEYFHYLALKKQGIKAKSAGIGFLLIIPLAFVEPDEDDLMRRSLRERIRVYSAGPTANLIVGLIALALLNLTLTQGITITEVVPNSYAAKYGLKPGDVIVKVNGKPVKSLEEFGEMVHKAGTIVLEVIRNGKTITIKIVKGEGKLGVYVLPFALKIPLPPSLALYYVFYTVWFMQINMGLAVINALPIFITDGGRVLYDLLGEKSLPIHVFTLWLLVMAMIKGI